MSREDALKFLCEDCVFSEPVSPSGAESLWLEHKRKVDELPADSSGPAEILPLSEADLKAVRKFRARHPREHSIVDVVRLNPMELVVHQHWVSPSLSERYEGSATPAKWNQTALLDPPAALAPNPRREGNTIVYDLPHSEFLLTERTGSEPGWQLTEPKAFVTVAFHGGRAVLLTGYHRTFALARRMMALPDAPRGVLFAVSNALEMLGSDADEVKAAMTSPRPPRVGDFFNSDLCLSLDLKRRQYQMRVNYEIRHLDATESAAGPQPPEPAVLPAPIRNHTSGRHTTIESATELLRNRRFEEAIQSYADILRIQPNNPLVHSNLVLALMETGRISEAKAHGERAVWLDPGNADMHSNLSQVLRATGAIDAAKRHCRQALAIDPEHGAALVNLGYLQTIAGELDAALSAFRQVLARKPESTDAWLGLSAIKTFFRRDADLAALERLESAHRITGKDAVYLHFALAKAAEDCGDFDRGFDHLRIAHEHQKRLMPYDEKYDIEFFNGIIRSFGHDSIERFAGKGSPSRVPIFVIGMPRSGTTLIEQILASHHGVYGAGELDILPSLLRTIGNAANASAGAGLDTTKILQLADGYLKSLPIRPEGERIVDKMPSNFMFAGLIHLLFPNAKIIHAVRDPLDTCMSCYSRFFQRGQHFSYDLAELGRYYTRYRKLMDHWHSVLPAGCILDVQYEKLVDDFDAQAARLLDFCELEWDENCRSFYRTNRPVDTASMTQVRKPLYNTSIGRWRRFEKHLGPLIAELRMEGAHGVGLVA